MRMLAFGITIVLLGWISVPLGSYRPVSLAIIVMAVALGLFLLSARSLHTGERVVSERSNFAFPALLIGAMVLWQILLFLPLPGEDSAASVRQIMLWGALLLVFWLFAGLTQGEKQLWVFSVAIVLIVAVQALGGLVLGFMGISFVPEQYIDGHFSRVRGSFVNANHFAAFVNLGIGLLMGAFVALAPETNSRGVRQSNNSTRGRYGAEFMILVVAGLMAAAVLLSGSRGAALGLAAAAFMLFVCTVSTRRRSRERIRALTIMLSVIAAGVLVIFFAKAGTRLTDADGFSERLWMWSVALDAAMLQPITGFGSGAFQWLPGLVANELPRDVRYDDAHNLFMETLAEQGVVGLGLLVAFFGVVVINLVKGLRHQEDTLRVAIIIGVLCGGCAIIVQSLVDFQFEVPANGVFFIAAIALALAAADPAWSGGGMRRRGHRHG